jgi:hypothetical protein
MSNDQAELRAADIKVPVIERVGLRPNVSVHFLEQDSVLFDPAAQHVYAANTSATFIWCCLEEGLTSPEVIERLQAAFGITREEAADYFGAAVQRWRDLGLISWAGTASAPGDGREADLEQPGEAVAVDVPAAVERLYRLLDVTFRFGFSSRALADETDAVLASLAATAVPQRYTRLDVLSRDGGYVVIKEGRKFRHCPREDQIVPLLKTCMVELALRESGDFAAVHAGAIGRDGRCILLPGVTGSGKSTLTAALVASGLQLLGDDTIVLEADTLAARPVPFGICVKDGAWQLLSSRFPELQDQPIHNRLDGKRVRYLVGTKRESWADPDSRFKVRAVAFIRRIPGARGALLPISRSEALARLTSEFCLLVDRLDPEKLDQLVGWIAGLGCYELQYSSLEDGVELVEGLLA